MPLWLLSSPFCLVTLALGFRNNGDKMSKGNRPLITPITSEQHAKEKVISNQIRDAEVDTVCDILAQQSTPDGLNAVVENACGFAENTTLKLRDPETPAVACKEGCSWCCYQAVPVTAVEAFRIVRFLKTQLDKNKGKKVINKTCELDKLTRGLTPKARDKKRVACAFLQDDRCVVYPVRPLTCAEFTSFNVKDCKRGQRKGFKPGSIIHEKARMIVFRAVQQGLSVGLHTALPCADTAQLELTAAILCAINSPDAETSWINGSNLFSRAHLARNRK